MLPCTAISTAIGCHMSRVVYVILNYDSGQAYAGLTKRFVDRMIHHRQHKPTLFLGRHEVLKTVPMTDATAQRFEARAVHFLKSIGFQTVNVAKAGGLGGPILHWTKERCSQEALKYTARSDFARTATGAYYAAQRKGWLDDVCRHMTNSDPMRYLKVRGSRWHYVRRVPEHAANVDGRGTIRVSLRTSSIEVAQSRRDAMERADDILWMGE